MEMYHTSSFLPSSLSRSGVGAAEGEKRYMCICVSSSVVGDPQLPVFMCGRYIQCSSDFMYACSIFTTDAVSVYVVANLPAGLYRSVVYVGCLVASHCASVVDDKLNLSRQKESQTICVFLFPGGTSRSSLRTRPL